MLNRQTDGHCFMVDGDLDSQASIPALLSSTIQAMSPHVTIPGWETPNGKAIHSGGDFLLVDQQLMVEAISHSEFPIELQQLVVIVMENLSTQKRVMIQIHIDKPPSTLPIASNSYIADVSLYEI